MRDINQEMSLIQIEYLSSDKDFYNNVFKKTERIVSATFYIVSLIEQSKTHKVFETMLTNHALALHESNVASLGVRQGDTPALRSLSACLLALESTLTVLHSARLFGGEVLVTLSDEIDQVLRYLKHHVLADTVATNTGGARQRPLERVAAPAALRQRRQRPNIPKNDLSSDAILVYSELSDRTTRIKTVLEAKPNATIKDLTDTITDVSAKTIQRDLNSLIERGEVIRQGERRWSTYSITK
jgi:hypothetical protein